MIVTLTLNPAVDKTFFIDDFKINELNRAYKIKYNAGSKGINVSRIMKILNIDTTATGFLGGYGGKIMMSELSKEGVFTDFIETVANTRVNTKVVDIKNKTFTDINEPGEEIFEDELLSLLEKIDNLTNNAKMLVMGGSIQKGVPVNIYKTIIEKMNKKNIPCALDCGGELLSEGIKAKPLIIKPNLLELEIMANKKLLNISDVTYEAKKICKGGVKFVLVSMGADGALGVCDEKVLRVLPKRVAVKSTVGAGDSFLSGFIYGYLNNHSFLDCLKYAAAFASAKVQTEGTDLPTKDELFRLAEQIEIIDEN